MVIVLSASIRSWSRWTRSVLTEFTRSAANSRPWLGVSVILLSLLLLLPGCERAGTGNPLCVSAFGSQGTLARQFVEPRAIAASQGGKLFVIDRTGRVQRFSLSGEFEHSWIMPGTVPDKGTPSGICVDGEGRVFVADTHWHRVVVFDESGVELFRFGERGTGPGQLMLPTDVAVDSHGSIYVSEFGGNDRVQKFDGDGRYVLSFGDLSFGSASLQRPSALAIDGKDNVWVVDTSNHRVCCFDPHGRFVTSVGELGRGPGQLRYPRDVVVLPGGDLAVVDYGNNRLAYFDRNLEYSASWGQAGRRLTDLHMPINAAVADGVVFLADSKNHRVVSYACRPESAAGQAIASAVVSADLLEKTR